MIKQKRIAVITGTRAEYGLLFWLMQALKEHNEVDLKVIATGTHLSPYYGHTIDEIKKDNFSIDATVELLIDGDTLSAMGKSVGLGIISFIDALSNIKPDLVIVLGDRFEILSAAQASFFLKIPIVHIHGGELTAGALDDSIRHAITKLSSLHFVSAEAYRNRVIQMGERPQRVHTVGALGLEHFTRLKLYTKSELESSFQFKFGALNFLVAYHPVTAIEDNGIQIVDEIFEVLQTYPEAKIFVSGCNVDAGGKALMLHFEKLRSQAPEQIYLSASFGQKRFLSLLTLCDLMIGNSSSAIIEAPSAGVPSVNIGSRQTGRISGPSVIDCEPNKTAILAAVHQALSPDFKRLAKQKINPYAIQDCHSSEKMIEILFQNDFDTLRTKSFYDLEKIT